MAENRNGAQRARAQTIRYHAGDARLYTGNARSVFTGLNTDGDGTRVYEVRGNTAAAPLPVEPETAEPVKKKPAPQKSRQSRTRSPQVKIDIFAWFRREVASPHFKRDLYLCGAAALATILAMASILLGLSANYTKTVNQIAALQKETETCRQENEALKTQIELMFSKREVEAYAENTLHMVKSTVFNTVSITLAGDHTPAEPGSAAKSPQLEQLPEAFGDAPEADPIPVQAADGSYVVLPISVQTPESEG